MEASLVHVLAHLALHLLQHFHRHATAQRAHRLFSVHIESLLQNLLALVALPHAIREPRVHQLVLHVHVQLQQRHRPLLERGVGVGVGVDRIVLHVMRDAVDQRDATVVAAGRDQLVHHTARHLHELVFGMIGAHRAVLRIQVDSEALLDEQPRQRQKN